MIIRIFSLFVDSTSVPEERLGHFESLFASLLAHLLGRCSERGHSLRFIAINTTMVPLSRRFGAKISETKCALIVHHPVAGGARLISLFCGVSSNFSDDEIPVCVKNKKKKQKNRSVSIPISPGVKTLIK